MLPYRDSKMVVSGIVILFVLLLGYAYFEARGLLFGPAIEVSTKTTVVHDSYVTIKGRADRISALYMNGTRIPVTESGDFEQPFLLSVGYNYITLDASDAGGRKTHKQMEIIYEPLSTTTSTTAKASTTSE